MKKSSKGTIEGGLLLIGAGLLYYIWIRVTGIMIPCPFRLLTGIRCPGCGVTTMLLSVSRGDFHGAFHANPFLFITSPYLAALLIHRLRLSSGSKQETQGWKRSETAYLILLLLFGLFRAASDLLG